MPMTAIHIPYRPLTLRAGHSALKHLAREGLTAGAVGALPGAAGGPKAVGLTGLDKAVFGWLATVPRVRELIGASIGGWRFACAMQPDPATALERLARRYTAERYHARVTVDDITRQTRVMLDEILPPEARARLLTHPDYRLTLVLVQSHGLAACESRGALLAGLALAAACNTVARPLVRHAFTRVLCHDMRSALDFVPDDGIPTRTVPLTTDNLDAALMGTVAIPGVIGGVQLPGEAAGVYRDGGLTDYHLDFPFSGRNEITLYPHFTDRIVPGWFDKFLPWRKPQVAHHANTLLLAPSREYLARLPGGKLPDRNDFRRYLGRDTERERLWHTAQAESERLGDAFLELVEHQRWEEVLAPL